MSKYVVVCRDPEASMNTSAGEAELYAGGILVQDGSDNYLFDTADQAKAVAAVMRTHFPLPVTYTVYKLEKVS